MTISEQIPFAAIFYFGKNFLFCRSINKNMLEWFLIMTSKFGWILDDIRKEKIISATIWATTFWGFALLDIRQCPKLQSCAISKKLKMQPWENSKNPNFGYNLGPPNFFLWVLPLLLVGQSSKLSSYAISKLMKN